MAGVYLDYVTRHSPLVCPYFYIPYWQMFFSAPAVVCSYNLYRTWKSLGGDESYEPPLPKQSHQAPEAAVAASNPAAVALADPHT